MGLLDLFGKGSRQDKNIETETVDTVERPKIYSGMRLEVTTLSDRMLFIAKLQGLRGGRAELYQYSETTLSKDIEPLRVKIRGYNDYEKKAVYMEGTITPQDQNIWHVEDLTVKDVVNDRAFFRLATDIDATLTMFDGPAAGEHPCRLLNISIGGVCISSGYQYDVDDSFLLRVRLLEDRPYSALYCRVLRVIEKDTSRFEYGCKFVQLSEADQDQIAENIFAAQCKKRKT